MKVEKLNDGKGLYFTLGKDWATRLEITVNGFIYGFSVRVGRLFDITIWEKDF